MNNFLLPISPYQWPPSCLACFIAFQKRHITNSA